MIRGYLQSRIRQHGFTLIELLVVIAIISLLVSILVPSLQKARDLAKQVVCSGNMHSIGVALMLFAEEHKDTLPPYGPSGRYWYDQLGRDNDYLPNPRMYDDDPVERLGTVWKCTVPIYSDGSPRSDYGVNWYLAPGNDPGIPLGSSTCDPWPWPPADSLSSLIAPVPSESDCALLSDMRTIYFRRAFGSSSGMISSDPDEAFRHLGGANILFLDQHLECVPGDVITEYVTGPSTDSKRRFWGQWW